jgi:hypothetical protein
MEDEVKTDKPLKKSYDWLKQYQFQKGNNANPNGRPKGKSLKTFVREMFENMPEEDKAEFLKCVDPELVWRMSEGNPHSTEDSKVTVELPQPILDVIQQNNSNSENKLPV